MCNTLGTSNGHTYWFYRKDRFACPSEDMENIHQSDISQSRYDDHRTTACHTPQHHTHTHTHGHHYCIHVDSGRIYMIEH